MPDPVRVKRERGELLEALDRNLRLLAEYSRRAFEEANDDFHGEVAAKLRLLVYEPKGKGKSHRPLLLALMDEADADIPVTVVATKRPGTPAVVLSLREYLAGTAEWTTPGGRSHSCSYIDLICMWADQHGGAHEDWSFGEVFLDARYSGIFINDGERIEPALVRTLRQVTENVLKVAEEFRPRFRRRVIPPGKATAAASRPNNAACQIEPDVVS